MRTLSIVRVLCVARPAYASIAEVFQDSAREVLQALLRKAEEVGWMHLSLEAAGWG